MTDWPGQPEQVAESWPGQPVAEPQGNAPQVPISGPEGWSDAAKSSVNSTPVGGIMRAFDQGFREASGPDPLGVSAENKQWLAKVGQGTWWEEPFRAFNEGVTLPAASVLDGVIRTASGTYRGLQAAGIEAGLPRDVVSIPDAFMGSPGALGKPKFTSLKEPPGTPVEFHEWFSGSRAADEHGNPIPVYHGTSIEVTKEGFTSFSEAKRGDATGAPSAKEAFFFSENPEVARTYAETASAYEDVAALRMVNNVSGGLYEKANEGFLGIFGRSAKRDGRIVTAAIDAKNPLIVDFEGKDFREESFHSIIQRAKEAGYDSVLFKNANDLGMVDDPQIGGALPSNIWAVFKPEQVKIAQFQREADFTLPQAKDLGVIGPERPPIADAASPKEAADRAIPASSNPGEKVTQELSGSQDPWQQRFDQFVGKMEAPDDVKQLIREAAKENGDFMPARQGEIPLSHVESIAEAAGVAPEEINVRGLGRKLQNDNEVRVAMQMMLKVTDDVKDAARDMKTDGSPESMIKLQEALMRRDLAVEQVVGLRAEWGRTGNVIQEFQKNVKDQAGLNEFLKGKGRSPADLHAIADGLAGINDPTAAARLLNDMRNPTAWDKFKWYWVNSLISGPVTHAKYVVANAAFAGYESAVVTPIAGVIGAARRALTGGEEGVYMGEAAARTWGIVAGVPDALKAAVAAAKTGLQTPLPGEIAQNIIPKRNKNLTFQQTPIGGVAGTVIGLPSRGASAIHSFYNFLGYRASIEAQAYRAAAKEGLSLSDDAFWQRRASMADKPTPDMMNSAIEEGYRLTYISELGETGRKLSAFVNATKVGQLVMPFTHIPLNILKRSIEGTPAAFLDAETREALSGAKGAAKQDTAIARMVAGSAVGAWAVNQVLNERMTGFGPTDPKERAQWMATGHQPYSIRIGDYWYSFNRFGSLGTMLGLYSNLAEVIPHMKPDAEELTKAIGMTVHSTGRLMEDEVGMQGLAGLMDAINEPDRKGVRFVSNFAGSLLPYSSMQRQIASSMDPYMRDTKSVVDGLRYYIPVAREGLMPKRDWSGLPVTNASYGGDTAVPGVSSIIQHRNAVSDPLALEMAALDLHPAPPQNRIGGVKLPPKIYDAYQSTAGAFTREALGHFIEQPGWHDMPPFVREKMFRATIEATRKAAGAATQMQYPQIIQQGVDDRLAKINGVKPTKLKE